MANQFTSGSIYTELIFLPQTKVLCKMHNFAVMLEGIKYTVLLKSEKGSCDAVVASVLGLLFQPTGTLWATILKSQNLE